MRDGQLGAPKQCISRGSGVGVSQHPRGKAPRSAPPGRTERLRSILLLGSLAVLLSTTLEAAPEATLRDPEYQAAADAGFRQIFDLDYDAASTTFSSLETRYPEHPGPPLGAAAVLWLQELFERQDFDLNRFIAPGYFNKDSEREMPISARRLFFQKVERGRGLSEEILARDPNHRDARFFLGSAEGLLAAFSYTVDGKTLEAFGHAKKAYQYHRELVDFNPTYSDAYVSLGVYEYIVDNLRWYLKWPAKMIGYRGSEERGIEYLETARRGESSVSNEASAMLMVIYFREKKYQHSLAIVRGLRQHFPKNFLFHVNHAQILERMGSKTLAIENYLGIVATAEQNRPNYQKLPLDSFRYALGRRLQGLGRKDFALQMFNDCLASSAVADSEKALCHVEAGLIEDEGGRRQRALDHYQAALALPRVEDSHRIARRHLRAPYRSR